MAELPPKMGKPALRALENIGVTKLSDVSKVTEKEIKDLHGFGPKAFGILKDEMSDKGVSFKG